jgi:hypothetical protein
MMGVSHCAMITPLQVERLGDNHQDVRQAACNLMLEVLQVSHHVFDGVLQAALA